MIYSNEHWLNNNVVLNKIPNFRVVYSHSRAKERARGASYIFAKMCIQNNIKVKQDIKHLGEDQIF